MGVAEDKKNIMTVYQMTGRPGGGCSRGGGGQEESVADYRKAGGGCRGGRGGQEEGVAYYRKAGGVCSR